MISFRSVILFAILFVAAIATVIISARPVPPVPKPNAVATWTPLNSYLIDVAGWYEITPNESAVFSPFDLSIEGLKSLPAIVGSWRGEPYDMGPAIDQWFENPDLALSNFYRDDRGHQAWLSVFGSRGRKSYVLFEHTPATSYPAAGWTLEKNFVAQVPIDARAIFVQEALLSKGMERRVALYWYVWNDFNRDPEKGVLTMRLHIPVISTDTDAFNAGADFLRALFPQVTSWRRF